MILKSKHLILLAQLLLHYCIDKSITAVKNKTSDVSNLIKKIAISETENKITTDHDHDGFIITQKLNKLTSESINAKLAKVNLASKNNNANFVNKTDFDNKLKIKNKKNYLK